MKLSKKAKDRIIMVVLIVVMVLFFALCVWSAFKPVDMAM